MTTIRKRGFALAALAIGLIILAALGSMQRTKQSSSCTSQGGSSDTSRLTIEDMFLLQDEGMQKLVAFDDSRALQDTDTSACDPQRAPYVSCLISNTECDDCLQLAIDALFEESNTTSCTDFGIGVCPAIATDCPCGDLECRQASEDFYECVLATINPDAELCQTLDCGLAAATDAPTQATESCPQELEDITLCPYITQECVDCINDAFNAQGTQIMCTDFIDTMCTAIEQDCPCDGCQDEIENFYDCYITDALGGSCSLSCDAYEPTDPIPPPTAPPANPTTVETSESTSIGPIIGGAVGGLAVVCATIFGICYMQKRGRSEQSQFESNKQPVAVETEGPDHPPQTIDASTAQPSVSTWATPDSYQPKPPPQPVPTRDPSAGPGEFGGAAQHSWATTDSYQPKPPPQPVPTRDPSAGPGEFGGAAQHSPPQSPGYTPNFKDQARSVAPPVPPVVEATPVEDSYFGPPHLTPGHRAALDP